MTLCYLPDQFFIFQTNQHITFSIGTQKNTPDVQGRGTDFCRLNDSCNSNIAAIVVKKGGV